MQQLKKIILLSFILVCSGCAGFQDYTVELPNGFRIDCLSAHQIGIYAENPIVVGNYSSHQYIPPKVTHVAWTDEYIFAKQVDLVNGDVPSNPEHYMTYWIINMKASTLNGQLSKEEFKQKILQLNIGDIQLLSVDALPHT